MVLKYQFVKALIINIKVKFILFLYNNRIKILMSNSYNLTNLLAKLILI